MFTLSISIPFLITLILLNLITPNNAIYLNDVIRYFFSATAQTLGALIAIIFSVIIIFISSIKPVVASEALNNDKFTRNLEIPTNEPIKRLILRDIFFIISISSGLCAILLSLIFIIPSAKNIIGIVDYYVAIFGIFIVLFLCILSILTMCKFIFQRISIYTSSNQSLILQYSKQKIFTNFILINYCELFILNQFKQNISFEIPSNVLECLYHKNTVSCINEISELLVSDIEKYSPNSLIFEKYIYELSKIIYKLNHYNYSRIFLYLITEIIDLLYDKSYQISPEALEKIINIKLELRHQNVNEH